MFSVQYYSCSCMEPYYFSVLSTLILMRIGSAPSICLENLRPISILLQGFPNQFQWCKILHFRFTGKIFNLTPPTVHLFHFLSKLRVFLTTCIFSDLLSALPHLCSTREETGQDILEDAKLTRPEFSSFISKSYTKIIGLARFTGSCRNKEAQLTISPTSA